jgi:redox-sensitive bicupin YhaK (pirin superfamily)
MRRVMLVETSEGAGAVVRRVFPTRELMHFDLFLLLEEFSIRPLAGFPYHLYRGFEVITYMLEGGPSAS